MKSNFILRFKQFVRKNKGRYEVWDTSGISTHPELFKQHVSDPNICVVVPQGVHQELSNGRHHLPICKEMWNFLNSTNNVIFEAASDEMHSWPIDDQVIHVVQVYHNKGYNVTLVTCDRQQSSNAVRFKELKCRLLAGIPNNERRYERTVQATRPGSTNEKRIFTANNEVPISTIPVQGLSLPCIKQGKKYFVKLMSGMALYDVKGKRKIPNNDLIEVLPGESLTLREEKYKVSKITEKQVVLEGV